MCVYTYTVDSMDVIRLLTVKHLVWFCVEKGTKRLECIAPDGTGRRVIHSNLNYPFSMVFYANHFYYTDWRRSEQSPTDTYIQNITAFT